jgi:hypothetical protein
MSLVNHVDLGERGFITEWLLSNAVLSAHWQQSGILIKLSLRPAGTSVGEHAPGIPTKEARELIFLVYAQALVLLAHRLSLDDPLQEAVVTERMALEQMWLQQSQWRDDRPYDDTAIPLKPFKA